MRFLIEARVTDADNNVLYETFVERRSRRLDFVEWAGDNARRLRNEAARVQNDLAAAIVGRVLLGKDSE